MAPRASPILFQLDTVQSRPAAYQGHVTSRQCAFIDFTGGNCDLGFMLCMHRVEMRLTVVIEVHRDRNSVEATDRWHGASVPSRDARVVRAK